MRVQAVGVRLSAVLLIALSALLTGSTPTSLSREPKDDAPRCSADEWRRRNRRPAWSVRKLDPGASRSRPGEHRTTQPRSKRSYASCYFV
jgi:hypothetical protein